MPRILPYIPLVYLLLVYIRTDYFCFSDFVYSKTVVATSEIYYVGHQSPMKYIKVRGVSIFTVMMVGIHSHQVSDKISLNGAP